MFICSSSDEKHTYWQKNHSIFLLLFVINESYFYTLTLPAQPVAYLNIFLWSCREDHKQTSDKWMPASQCLGQLCSMIDSCASVSARHDLVNDVTRRRRSGDTFQLHRRVMTQQITFAKHNCPIRENEIRPFRLDPCQRRGAAGFDIWPLALRGSFYTAVIITAPLS